MHTFVKTLQHVQMRRPSYITLTCLIFIGFTFSCSNKTRQKDSSGSGSQIKATLLAPDDFEAKLNSLQGFQLIDVRTPGEFAGGYIKGAININYQGDSFEAEIARLDKNRPTLVYCQAGGRSSEACEYMGKQGFKEIYDLQGGMNGWDHANKPVEK
jgi:rhodanese-related sulfurtransferase